MRYELVPIEGLALFFSLYFILFLLFYRLLGIVVLWPFLFIGVFLFAISVFQVILILLL